MNYFFMFDNLNGLIWINGKFVNWSDAKIHVMSHGLHYGSSVFEGIRSYNGFLFKAKEHYERLHQSAKYLDFYIPYSVDELIDVTKTLIESSSFKEGYVRAIGWCGSKVMKVSNNGADVNVAIGIWDRPVAYPNHFYTNGIKMNIADWRRPNPKTAPVHSKASGLYMTSSISKKSSEIMGFNDSLMLDCDDNIAEATSSNIFIVANGSLYTPLPTCFLNGITRIVCIEIAKNIGIDVFEGIFPLDFLDKADEVFLTGTAIEILPVGSIEGIGKKWTFKPGRITSSIYEKFKKNIQALLEVF